MIFRGDLEEIVPEKLRAGDVEELSDLEFLLVECLRAECLGAGASLGADSPTPEFFSQSQVCTCVCGHACARACVRACAMSVCAMCVCARVICVCLRALVRVICVCVCVCVQEIPPRGKDASSARFDIVMNITKGLRGRPKTYTFTLSIPLVAASTAEDKVPFSATSQLRCSSSSMCACSKHVSS